MLMQKVQVKEVSTRLGKFCVIRMGNFMFLTPCDTRLKIIKAIATKEMNAEEISSKVGAAYSTVMDHMDVLEKLGLVTCFLKRGEGRRKIYFKLNDNPDQWVQTVFAEPQITS